jgi:hypothetical protein
MAKLVKLTPRRSGFSRHSVQTSRVANVLPMDHLHTPPYIAETTSMTMPFLLRKVDLVLVAIHSAVILSPDFNQVHSGNKENDRGMDV